MSRRVLLTAVRDAIRSELGYATAECELTGPLGMPPPSAGRWFAGVWAGARQNLDRDRYALKADYSVTVTLTMKVQSVWDRVGLALILERESGFYDRVERIAALVHKDSYDLFISRAANSILGDPTRGDEPVGFTAGLAWISDTAPRWAPANWFHAGREQEKGVVCDIHFGRAVRVQNVANVPTTPQGGNTL